MQIQPFATSPAPKLDDRPVAVTGQAAVAGRTSPDASAAAPSREEVAVAVKKLNEAIPPSARSLEFEIDKELDEIVVKIVDIATGDVVRQMPTKEALDMAKAIDKMQGLLIKQTA